MFDRALWDLVFKMQKAERAQTRRAWAWIKETYDGELEVHTANSIFDVKVVAFTPVKRKYLNPFKNPKVNDSNGNVLVKRKAVSVHVPPFQVKTLEQMHNTGAGIPWIRAALKKRGPKREIAWMLLMKEVIVAEKIGTFEGDTEYYLICRDITEMIPRSLVDPPMHVLA